MFEMGQIIGKSVEKVRGYKGRKNQKYIEPTHILFNDGETFVKLNEQDYYSNHDCAFNARIINVYKDAGEWCKIAYDNDKFGDANMDI